MYLRQGASNLLQRLRNHPATFTVSSLLKKPANHRHPIGEVKLSGENGFGYKTRGRYHGKMFQWIFLPGQAAIILGMTCSPAFADDVSVQQNSENGSDVDMVDLRKIEDGSVVSNIHTAKWRVFTDSGRDFFLQGKLLEAETMLVSAVKEAREGFGESDPHVASACNNLAELYRVKKEFTKAEPLYLEAIHILEESYGPEDIRVGAALHNLGQFYLVQRKLEQARNCYERSLKIKKRVLGEGNSDYADTMYHLGSVVYLEGREEDSVALIRNSIQILEESGLGESLTCLRRLQHLVKIHAKSNRIADVENIQRKILYKLELSKGWTSLDTVIAAEQLAKTVYITGDLSESEELLERCIDSRKKLFPKDHIENAGNMIHLAKVKTLKSKRLRETDISQAMVELDKAKKILHESERIARQKMVQVLKDKGKWQPNKELQRSARNEKLAMLILLQSLNALGNMELEKAELHGSKEDGHLPFTEIENKFRQCISAFKEFGAETAALTNPPEVKVEYLSCLRQLFALIDANKSANQKHSKNTEFEELKDEINRVEADLSTSRRQRS